MAVQVEQMTTRRGRPEEYDWDTFLTVPDDANAGPVWRFIKGDDFTAQSASFLAQARRAAERRGLRVRTSTVETDVLKDEKGKVLKDDEGNPRIDGTIVEIQAFRPLNGEADGDES